MMTQEIPILIQDPLEGEDEEKRRHFMKNEDKITKGATWNFHGIVSNL